jgi:hypothetical protein
MELATVPEEEENFQQNKQWSGDQSLNSNFFTDFLFYVTKVNNTEAIYGLSGQKQQCATHTRRSRNCHYICNSQML